MPSQEIQKSATAATPSERRYEIDWLRLMAVFLLFFFHTARIFDPEEKFYVQNNSASPTLFSIFIRPLGPWHMALFFLLAGASSYFALRHRSGGQYAKERLKRLLIPFVFGVLVLIPPQSYLGLISHSDYSQSFFRWFPDFFRLQEDDVDGYFMGGHTWGHLWFIFHLFIYSMAAVSLFVYLNRESGRRVVNKIASVFAKPGVILFFPALLVLLAQFPDIVGGNPLFYIALFICGFLLMSDPWFMKTVDRWKILLLILGPVIFVVILIMMGTNTWPTDLPGWANDTVDAYFDGFVPWYVILTLLAYGRKWLNSTNRFLKYFADGAYPLYLLHQTVIVVIGYYVVQADIAVAAKYTIIVAASLVSSVLIYDLVVRRINVTRFLFGMRPLSKKLPPAV